MNNPDNWDLMDSLNRVGTVARNKFIEWWRHLNGSTDNPGYLYDMAIKLYFENRHPTPPVNDMAGLKAELEALRVFVMSFCDGYSCDHGNDICYCTKPEVKILIKLASILSKYPTAPLPKPSTDSQVEGLREVLKNGLNSCRKLKQDPLQHGGYQYWNGLEQGLLDVADKIGLKCEDCHGSGMVGSGSDGLDYCHCDMGLSRHPVNACKGEIEPLAELADRVNHKIVLIKNCNYPIGWIIHVQPKSATHLGGIEELPRGENVYTYAAAEQAAREYLMGLENKGGEK